MNKLTLKIAIFALSSMAFNALADADLDSYEQSFGYDELLNSNDERILNGLKEFDDTVNNGRLVKGEVVFNFGNSRNTVVCAILELCDISLEQGEKIRGVQLGDTARWSVDTAVSGMGATHTEHLIVKPLEVGLKTSLIIATDRRAYHLRLKSSADEYMPQVRFIYPSDNLESINRKVRSRSFSEYSVNGAYNLNNDNDEQLGKGVSNIVINSKSIDESNPKVRTIKFNSVKKNNYSYDLDGDALLYPTKIWNDGSRTFIKMKKNGFTGKMPALMEVNTSGFIFKDEKLSPINYRIEDSLFVIDGLPRHVRLKLGGNDDYLSCDIVYKG